MYNFYYLFNAVTPKTEIPPCQKQKNPLSRAETLVSGAFCPLPFTMGL